MVELARNCLKIERRDLGGVFGIIFNSEVCIEL
jgi:hypothetical protein